MGLKTKLTRKIGRLLELSGRGVWCETKFHHQAIYLFLYGRKAELTAWLLPSSAELKAACPNKKSPLILIVFTDQSSIMHLMQQRGHYVLQVDSKNITASQNTSLLKNILRIYFAQFTPMRAVFSPEFFYQVRYAREISHFIGLLLSQYGSQPIPNLLLNELEVPSDRVFHFIYRIWSKQKSTTRVPMFYFGDPSYVDLTGLYANKSYLDVQSLGWRMEGGQAEWDHQKIYICLKRPSIKREIVRYLISRNLNKQIYCNSNDVIEKNVNYMELPDFLEELKCHPGLVIADTSAPLLAFLSLGTPVVLLRNECTRSQLGLIKFSFFLGQERWPILSNSSELAEILRLKNLREWWQPWADKKGTLEKSLTPDCKDAFIQNIYAPQADITALSGESMSRDLFANPLDSRNLPSVELAHATQPDQN